RLRRIAACAGAAITSCEEQAFQQCSWNAASLPTQPKLHTPKVLRTGKNSQKKLQLESEDAIPLAVPCPPLEWRRVRPSLCNRTWIKRRRRHLNTPSPSVRTKKAR